MDGGNLYINAPTITFEDLKQQDVAETDTTGLQVGGNTADNLSSLGFQFNTGGQQKTGYPKSHAWKRKYHNQ